MESNRDVITDQLRSAERGEAAGWTGYRFPRWIPVAMGVWAGSFAMGIAYLDGVVGAAWSLAHLAITFAYMWWDRRSQAAFPASGADLPPEYRRAMTLMFLGAAVVAPVAWLVGWLAVGWAGALVAAIGWGGTIAVYNRQYAAASAQVRERLA